MLRKIMDNKIFKIIYGIIRAIIILFLFLYLGFVLIQRLTNNSDIMGYRVFTVATGSMEPVYKVNDVILVKTVDTNTLKVGDDVAYIGRRDSVSGMLVTHRIIRIETVNNEIRYILKGVNNQYEDPSITSDQILGKVMGKVYVVNFINHVVKNSFGFFFLVFCPLVLVIFLEIADTILDMKLEKEGLSRDGEEESDEEGKEDVKEDMFIDDVVGQINGTNSPVIAEVNGDVELGNASVLADDEVKVIESVVENSDLDSISSLNVVDGKKEEFGDVDEEII